MLRWADALSVNINAIHCGRLGGYLSESKLKLQEAQAMLSTDYEETQANEADNMTERPIASLTKPHVMQNSLVHTNMIL